MEGYERKNGGRELGTRRIGVRDLSGNKRAEKKEEKYGVGTLFSISNK